MRETRVAWDAIRLRYHVMRNTSSCSLETRILGQSLEWPVLIAPMALQKMAHPDGELATVAGANRMKTPMIVSTLSTLPIEQLAAASNESLWFQLYIERDREASRALVERAQHAGCRALVVTVDSPVLGRRERDVRNGFHLPEGLSTPHVRIATRSTLAEHEVMTSALASYVAHHWDNSISWRDLEWLRSITSLPILVKGVVRGDDALLALEHGASGVIVSTHGGRQLDAAIPTPRALPDVAEAMSGKGTLMVDGGIRRGTDVIKALAMGADAVLLGRPVLWGLSIAGADGVAHVLQLLRDECELGMALSGCRSIDEATPDLIAR
jgi:4-hydroxymandelate oxidase